MQWNKENEMKNVLLSMIVVAAFVANAFAQKSDPGIQSKSFNVKPGGTVTVDVDPGSIIIESWDKNEVQVEADGIDERHPERLIVSQSGNDISVRYTDRRARSEDIEFRISVPSAFNAGITTGGGSVKQRGDLTGKFTVETGGGSITVDHVIGNVSLETGGGSIKTRSVEGDAKLETGGGSVDAGGVTGTLHVTTGGGSITLRKNAGPVEAETGGGSIRVEDAQSSTVLTTGGGGISVTGSKNGTRVKTGGGSINLENIRGYVVASTGGGSIDVELIPEGNTNSSVTTGGGEIQLRLPENAKARIDAEIEQGHGWGRSRERHGIRSDFPAENSEKDEEGSIISARYILNGGGPTIVLRTSGSDIEIIKSSSR